MTSDKKWRILCIDDDPDLLLVLQALLSTQHEVVTADNGVEAVAMLDFCDADFIICDVRMPDMDGFQTVEAIRGHPDYADIPVFFLTAETAREMAKRGFESGGNLYLTKPFDSDRLLENIAYFLEQAGGEPRAKRLSADKVAAAARGEGAAASGEPVAADSGGGAARIIVICEPRDQLDALCAALGKRYECIGCADPLASLQQAFRYEPDALVINPALKRLSGWGLTQMISANPRFRDVGIVLIDDGPEPLNQRLAQTVSPVPPVPTGAPPEEIVGAVEAALASLPVRVRPKRTSLAALLEEEAELRRRIARDAAREERRRRTMEARFRRVQNFIDRHPD